MCYCVNTSKQSSLKCCKEKQYTSSKTKDVIAVHSLYNKYPPFRSLITTSYLLISTTLKQLTLTNISNVAKHLSFLQSNTTSKNQKF